MSAALSAKAFTVSFRFHGDLSFFLPKENRETAIAKTLHEKTSVKDAIESCGVPHPEVDLIYCDGVAVPFEYLLTEGAVVDVHGLTDSPAKPGEGLQRRRITKFIADGHLGKLARDLRLLGFDVAYDPKADRWTTFPALPGPRHGFAAAVAGDKLFFIGGSTRCGGGGKIADVVQLTLR